MRLSRRLGAATLAAILALSLVPSVGAASTPVLEPLSLTVDFSSVSFSDAQHGWIAGSYDATPQDTHGVLLTTSDGGATWRLARDVSGRNYIAGLRTGSGTGFLLNRTPHEGELTAFDGVSWSDRAVAEADQPSLTGIDFIDTWRGSVVGQASSDSQMGQPAAVYSTTDGGVTWSRSWAGPLPSEPTTDDPEPTTKASLTDVDFSGNYGWAVGANENWTVVNGAPTKTGIDALWVRSTDGGSSWTSGTASYPNEYNASMTGIAAVDGSKAWAVGTQHAISNGQWGAEYLGLVAYTSNGGASWTATSTIVGTLAFRSLRDVAVTPSGTVVAVGGEQDGSAGKIYRKTTTQAWGSSETKVLGSGYSFVLHPTVPTLRSVSFPAGTHVGWAVGSGSTLLKTTDDGRNWTKVTIQVDVSTPELASDEIPGVALGSSPATGAVDAANHPHFVYRLNLAPGDQLTASVVTSDVADLDARLFSYDATTVAGSAYLVASSADPTSAPLVYTSASGSTHYLDIQAQSGSATFTVPFSVTHATKVSLARSTSTVSYGGTATLTARLLDSLGNPTVLGVRTIALDTSTDSGKTWKSWKTVTTAADGSVMFPTSGLTRTTYFRARFLGEGEYRASSGVTSVAAKVALSVPSCGYSTIRRARYYTYTGTLRPRHTSGTKPVKLYFERYASGKWTVKKTAYAVVSNATVSGVSGSKYSVKLALPYTGKWRVRAYHLGDSTNASTYSNYRSLTVR